MATIIKKCRVHGETEFIVHRRGGDKCRKCNSERSKRKRLLVKEALIQHKGGKCQGCGYDTCIQALEFHHEDPSVKEFELSKNTYAPLHAMFAEVEKCVLLCANCHREVHAGVRTLENKNGKRQERFTLEIPTMVEAPTLVQESLLAQGETGREEGCREEER